MPSSVEESRNIRPRRWFGRMERWVRRAAGLVIAISLAIIVWAMPKKSHAEGLQHRSEGLGNAGAASQSRGRLSCSRSFSVWPLPFLADRCTARWGALRSLRLRLRPPAPSPSENGKDKRMNSSPAAHLDGSLLRTSMSCFESGARAAACLSPVAQIPGGGRAGANGP